METDKKKEEVSKDKVTDPKVEHSKDDNSKDAENKKDEGINFAINIKTVLCLSKDFSISIAYLFRIVRYIILLAKKPVLIFTFSYRPK